jgi:LmbE family N-acetylglucosaminyl deacetylase
VRPILIRIIVIVLAIALALTLGVSAFGGAARDLAERPAHLSGPRLLVIAPHPDDETLGAGGVIAQARKDGWHVTVVVVTNGDGFVESLREPGGPHPTGAALQQLGARRAEESRRGADALGVPSEDVIFLGYPDSRTMRLWQTNWDADKPADSLTGARAVPYDFAREPGAAYTGIALEGTLRQLIRTTKPTTVIFPDPSDRHRDHRAVSAFTQTALARAGYDGVQLTYLVHRPGFPIKLGNDPDASLEPPSSLSAVGTVWHRLRLDPGALGAKKLALTRYPSQLAEERRLLESFVRQNELYGTPPDLAVRPDRPAVLLDPVADTAARRLIPAADITSVQVLKSAAAARVVLHLRGPVASGVTYGLHVRALSAAGTRSFDALVRGGLITVERPSSTSVTEGLRELSSSASQISLTLPTELTRSADSIMIEADTSAEGVPVDFTAWRLVRLAYSH